MKDWLDFIVIGAGNSGSTSLFEYMRTHPELHLPPAKERPFFSEERSYRRGWKSYVSETFGGAPADALWGKVTPQYMAGSIYGASAAEANPNGRRTEQVVPARIARQLPDVKLIAIVRDPVARCISAHRMLVLTGKERRALPEAVRQLLTEDSLEEARRFPRDGNSYVVLGEYGRILAGYYETFSTDQLLTLFSSDLEDAPEATLRAVFGFLGVADDFIPPNLGVRYREGTTRRRAAWLSPEGIRGRMASLRPLRSAWRMIPTDRRRRVENRYWDAAYRVELWNRVSERPAGPDPEVREALSEHYETDRALLERLIGRRVPWRR